MGDTLTVSALARRAGVTSKTLRYWERRGLLPRAARSHTGYRLFDRESLRYVAFIQKSKAIGLTLAEMREILRLARSGHCPCPEVIEWTERKIGSLEEQVRSLSALLHRLKRIRRQWSGASCPPDRCGNVCQLIEELPEAKPLKGGKPDAKTVAVTSRRSGDACCDRVAGSGNGGR
ncbi:MAG TPA: MerR family transcriptional regulator [Terriglobia bacterium]|nr:MerR family transcriptional regulator [Terriglobia bacterium]